MERLKGQVIKRKKKVAHGINILKDCIRDREHKIQAIQWYQEKLKLILYAAGLEECCP